MNNKFSDEQIDKIAERLVKDFSLDAAELDEIADSPQLWWSVRKNIGAEAIPEKKSWFAGFGWMIPAFGIVALGICFGAAAWMFSAGGDSIVAEKTSPVQPESTESRVAVVPVLPDVTQPEDSDSAKKNAPLNNRSEQIVVRQKKAPQTSRPLASRQPKNPAPAKREAETLESKTDFIALSYAGNSEGGQVVRVKVPSAMMVTLGVVAEVEKDSAMVSADVVVGDDGLARAIRFIR